MLKEYEKLDFSTLAPKEHILMKFLSQGYTNEEIAYELCYAPQTITGVIRKIRDKLGIEGQKGVSRRVLLGVKYSEYLRGF
jgi:DNA-binding CsgD family transcriptional regulator